jgi:hypothetical protein
MIKIFSFYRFLNFLQPVCHVCKYKAVFYLFPPACVADHEHQEQKNETKGVEKNFSLVSSCRQHAI